MFKLSTQEAERVDMLVGMVPELMREIENLEIDVAVAAVIETNGKSLSEAAKTAVQQECNRIAKLKVAARKRALAIAG